MGETLYMHVHRLSKYKKLDPLEFYYDPWQKPILKRWTGNEKPNAMAAEDLASGGLVKVDLNGGIAEVRNG